MWGLFALVFCKNYQQKHCYNTKEFLWRQLSFGDHLFIWNSGYGDNSVRQSVAKHSLQQPSYAILTKK